MSQEVNDALTKENADLKKQLDQAVNQGNGLVAQLDAHKGMMSETIQGSLNVRASLIMFQKQNQKLNGKIAVLSKTIDSLNQQLSDATAKIAEISAP